MYCTVCTVGLWSSGSDGPCVLMQRVMASSPGKVPAFWVLLVMLLAALGASTIQTFAALQQIRPFWQHHKGAIIQQRLNAIHAMDECSMARIVASCHDAALVSAMDAFSAPSGISIFSSVSLCQLLTGLHRTEAHWHFDHSSCSARHSSCPMEYFARRELSRRIGPLPWPRLSRLCRFQHTSAALCTTGINHTTLHVT